MPAFVVKKLVRFQHCDPAGIVFYPEYFLMFNEVVEDWFQDGMGIDFKKLHIDDRLGIPTVKTACEFVSPSMVGDWLEYSLVVNRLGSSSVQLTIRASCKGEARAKLDHVIVLMKMAERKAIPWPEDMRERIARYVVSG